MGTPIFHIVKENEFGLSGIANPEPGVGRAGGDQGSMHMPTVTMSTGDCAVINGEVLLPAGHTDATYDARFLQHDLSIVNVGEDWALPSPDKNPELFMSWPCDNPTGRKQLKDFVITTFTDESGTVVKENRKPGLFSQDVFLKGSGVYKIGNRYPFACQRIPMDDLKDGTYRIEICVNPIFGDSIPAVVWVKFTGHDLMIVPEPADADGFPIDLVWNTFKQA